MITVKDVKKILGDDFKFMVGDKFNGERSDNLDLTEGVISILNDSDVTQNDYLVITEFASRPNTAGKQPVGDDVVVEVEYYFNHKDYGVKSMLASDVIWHKQTVYKSWKPSMKWLSEQVEKDVKEGTLFDTDKPVKQEGLKHDHDKPMYNLLPANAIDSLAKVLTFGANKYAPNSWQNVENGLERYRAALLRHTFAMQRGELLDPESGLPHSAHVMCCAAFINELEMIGVK